MKKIIPFIFAIILVVTTVSAGGIAFADEAVKTDERAIPVLMYHSILKSKKGTYFVSPEQLEKDISEIKNAGYEFVFPEEIIAFAEGRGDLPEKPILLTFDDGHYNNMYYGLDILEKYSAKAVINVIGAFSEHSTVSGDDSNPNYSHLTWGQIGELYDGGFFVFGNHTYHMHSFKPRYGIMPNTGESETEYAEAFRNDFLKNQEKLIAATGVKPTVFAYPFGRYNEKADEILKEEGIKITLTCNEGVSVVKKGEGECFLKLRRINRSGEYSTDDVLARIHGAK